MYAVQFSLPDGQFLRLQPNGEWFCGGQRADGNSSAFSLPDRHSDGDGDCLPAQTQLSQNVRASLHLLDCWLFRASLSRPMDAPFGLLEFGTSTTALICQCRLCTRSHWFCLCVAQRDSICLVE